MIVKTSLLISSTVRREIYVYLLIKMTIHLHRSSFTRSRSLFVFILFIVYSITLFEDNNGANEILTNVVYGRKLKKTDTLPSNGTPNVEEM